MKRIALALVFLLPAAGFTNAFSGSMHQPEGQAHGSAQINPMPSLKVILSGFLLLRFKGPNNPCEVGVPKACGKHNLNLYVVKLQEGKDPEVIYSYWGLPKDSIWLGVFRPKDPGVHRFGMGSFDPAKADKHDFGWAVDLEGPEYHNKSLEWDAERMAPLIHITNGLFYSDTLTEPTLTTIYRLRPNGARDEQYRQIATTIAADIEFDQSGPIKGFATLRFGQDVFPVAKMESDSAGTIRYELYIENQPLDPQHVKGSDFQDYYNLLKNDLTGEHFDFQFIFGKATNNLPCMPGILGGP
jgi:hypothetical protein